MTNNNFSQTAAFIWSVADLLRGDFKQSQYGRVILPFTLLRRLECVLETSKAGVVAENEKVKVGFFLGSNKIICKGLVKHTCSDTLGYTSGISLLDMTEDNKQIIQELYASAVLKEAI